MESSAPSHQGVRQVRRLTIPTRRNETTGELVVLEHQSEIEGPTVAITANIHGDESVGTAIVHALDAHLAAHPFAGRVLLYPSCNPFGLHERTRFVTGSEDLNRCFPGHPKGVKASRLAYTLWTDLKEQQVDALVDLHADAPNSVPYVILDRPVRQGPKARKQMAERLQDMASASGLTVLREYQDRIYTRFGLDKSLAGAVVNLMDVPAITLELGPRRRLNPEWEALGIHSCLGILSQLGVLGESPVRHDTFVEGQWRRTAGPTPTKEGLLRVHALPGDTVEAGDLLASVWSVEGTCLEHIVAEERSLVVAWVENSWVRAGEVVLTMGLPEQGGL